MKNMNIIAAAVLALGVAASASANTTYGLLTASRAALSTASNGTTASFADGLLTAGNDVSGPVWDALIYVSNSARNYITREGADRLKQRLNDGAQMN